MSDDRPTGVEADELNGAWDRAVSGCDGPAAHVAGLREALAALARADPALEADPAFLARLRAELLARHPAHPKRPATRRSGARLGIVAAPRLDPIAGRWCLVAAAVLAAMLSTVGAVPVDWSRGDSRGGVASAWAASAPAPGPATLPPGPVRLELRGDRVLFAEPGLVPEATAVARLGRGVTVEIDATVVVDGSAWARTRPLAGKVEGWLLVQDGEHVER